VDADLFRDIGQAHVADAVPERQLPGSVQDGVLALLFLLRTPRTLEGRIGSHGSQLI